MTDPLAPLEGETLMAYLVRTRPQYEWEDGDGANEPAARVLINDQGENVYYTLCARLSRAEWANYVGQVYPPPPPASILVAPVDPGEARKTYGETLALSNGLVIPGPLDGVKIAITAHPSGSGRWAFGEVSSWNNVGAIIFQADGGDYERAITIGLDSQTVVPVAMVRAASATLRIHGAWEGTITPWTIATV